MRKIDLETILWIGFSTTCHRRVFLSWRLSTHGCNPSRSRGMRMGSNPKENNLSSRPQTCGNKKGRHEKQNPTEGSRGITAGRGRLGGAASSRTGPCVRRPPSQSDRTDGGTQTETSGGGRGHTPRRRAGSVATDSIGHCGRGQPAKRRIDARRPLQFKIFKKTNAEGHDHAEALEASRVPT
jgi:hypothetical protein